MGPADCFIRVFDRSIRAYRSSKINLLARDKALLIRKGLATTDTSCIGLHACMGPVRLSLVTLLLTSIYVYNDLLYSCRLHLTRFPASPIPRSRMAHQTISTLQRYRQQCLAV